MLHVTKELQCELPVGISRGSNELRTRNTFHFVSGKPLDKCQITGSPYGPTRLVHTERSITMRLLTPLNEDFPFIQMDGCCPKHIHRLVVSCIPLTLGRQ
jgi:hypothetical protein